MKDWFESLENRERLFVSGGAVIVVIALIYGLLWAPLVKNQTALEADIAGWQRAIDELGPLRARQASGGSGQSSTVVSSQQSPIIVVDQTLRNRGLDRYRKSSQPTTSNGIRVVFENVAFDDLVLWLGDLSDSYGMNVQAASFAAGAQATPGRVNATLTLERVL